MTLAELMSEMALNIQTLYTFHLVARFGAMHLAADHLGVTPGAISQRIRTIERDYGKRLFTRTRNGVELTKMGEILWSDTSNAFGKIEAAHSVLAGPKGKTLRISTTAAFAHASLVPRLGDFIDAHPDIHVHVETDTRVVDLASEPIDIAIRHGLGNFGGLTSRWLGAQELIVVGSPGLLGKGQPVQTPADCLNYRLLERIDSPDWSMWFGGLGLSMTDAKYAASYKDVPLLVRAAVQGQGLALVSDTYVRDELATGALINPLQIAWPTKFAFYAVARPETLQQPAARAFVDWLARDVFD